MCTLLQGILLESSEEHQKKMLDCDAVVGVKGMDGTMLRISQSMRDRLQALKGGLLLTQQLGRSLVIKTKLKLLLTSHNTFYSNMKASSHKSKTRCV